MELSKVPGQLEIVLSEILEEIEEIKGEIDCPRKVVYFCELSYYASCLLLKRNKPGDVELAVKFAKEIINKVSEWKGKIQTEDKYPPLKFMGRDLVETPSFTNFEVFSELINYGRRILEKLKGKQYTEGYFGKFQDKTLKAAYFYNVACDFHFEGEEMEAMKALDKCIELDPHEATFYYMKALWAYQYLSNREVFGKLTSTNKRKLMKLIGQNLKRAMQLAPNWKKPKDLFENLKAL
jgi:tetratricopeptide (TPR) repeat protein